MGKKTENKSVTPLPAQILEESPDQNLKKSPETSKRNSDHICYKIRLLDNAQPSLNVSISKNDTGEKLFTIVCDELGGIVERDYFGLRYTDKNKIRQWLDLGRSVKKQMAGAQSTALSFRVKHYPGDPISDFHQEISQYLLYLQIRRDLIQGRLLCPTNELYTLGALIYQSELGDAPEDDANSSIEDVHSPEREHIPTNFPGLDSPTSPDSSFKAIVQPGEKYYQNLKIVFNQNKTISEEFAKLHKSYRGLTARDAEIEIIKRASVLPTYGVDPVPVKLIQKTKLVNKKNADSRTLGGDEHSDLISTKTAPVRIEATNHESDDAPQSATIPSGAVYLGLRHTGLTTYVGLEPSDNYTWDQINRLACDGKDFIVILKPEEVESTNKKRKRAKPQTVIFRCDSKAAALATWKWTVDRKSFFTLKMASEAKKTMTTANFFRRRHSYRFIGKSQSELKSITASGESIPQPAFERVSSLRRCPKSSDSDLTAKHATLPARIRTHAGDERYPFLKSEPTKRPEILGNVSEQAQKEDAPSTQTVDQEPGVLEYLYGVFKPVMKISDVFLSSAPEEPETPIRPVIVNQVEMSQPDITPIFAERVSSVTQAPEFEVRERTKTPIIAAKQDSESVKALKEIDRAIDSHQLNNKRSKSPEVGVHNGEVPRFDDNHVQTVVEKYKSMSKKESSSNTLVHIAEAATVFLGVVCFTVIIVALESHPRPGQTDVWSSLASRVQGQPLVASFNNYIYSPIRGHVVGGFSTLSSWLTGR